MATFIGRDNELSELKRFLDKNTAFTYLAQFTQNNRVIIALDEISWMGSKDPAFLSKLKNAWDKKFKKNHQLILILCGSASAWIKKIFYPALVSLVESLINLRLKNYLFKIAKIFGATHQKILAHMKN